MTGKAKWPGILLMSAGLLLLAAALRLTAYNLWDEHRASASVAQTMEEIIPAVRDSAPQDTGGGEAVIPDYQLDPGRDRPVVDIDGRDYIGTLSIPALGLSLPVLRPERSAYVICKEILDK